MRTNLLNDTTALLLATRYVAYYYPLSDENRLKELDILAEKLKDPKGQQFDLRIFRNGLDFVSSKPGHPEIPQLVINAAVEAAVIQILIEHREHLFLDPLAFPKETGGVSPFAKIYDNDRAAQKAAQSRKHVAPDGESA